MSHRKCEHSRWPHVPTTIINMEEGENECHHVHEFEGSTHLAEQGDERHNHRFAGVTCEAIPISGGMHIHKFHTNTDFFEDHHHKIEDTTGPNINVSHNKHVHFVKSVTTFVDGHKHKLEFSTLIGPSPIT